MGTTTRGDGVDPETGIPEQIHYGTLPETLLNLQSGTEKSKSILGRVL